MKRLAILGAILALAACASSPSGPPEWLEHPEGQYPQARFLVGQGEAETAAVARDRARADLLKIFETRVSEESRDTSVAKRASGDGKTTANSSEFKTERQVNVATTYAMEGIRIADMWHDETRGSHHAVAVVDRLQAAERLRAEIMRMDDLTGREMANAKAASDLFAQIDAAAKAVDAQRWRDGLQRELRVVDPTGVGIPSRYDGARLASDLNLLTKRLRLIPEVETDPVGNLASILAGAIARAGFTPAKKDDANAYRLVGDLVLDENRSGGWHWSKGVLQVKVLDADGNVRSSQRWPIKESGRQEAVARQRAMGEVDRLLRNQLREAVLGGIVSGDAGARLQR